MEPIIIKIHKLLIEKRKTIAVAESCTGGLVSNQLTLPSGSSNYFILGIVSYSNAAKTSVLNIPSPLIAKEGAVSKKVASAMAKSVRKIAASDFSIGITGIAGPTGATKNKPVGTVFISVDTKNRNICKKFLFKGNRLQIRKKAALKALKLLKQLMYS